MKTSLQETNDPARMGEEEMAGAANIGSPAAARVRVRTLLAVPVAASVALVVHLLVSKEQPETQSYSIFLCIILGSAIVAAAVQSFSSHLRRWLRHMCPIIAGAVSLSCLWEVITSGLRLLPLPYFPGPAGVLQSLIDDRASLLDSAWNSLQLLLAGYALGVAVALGGMWVFALSKALQVRRSPVEVGPQLIAGSVGEVRENGLVYVNGELWQARAVGGQELRRGDRVRVESLDGLVLTVRSEGT